MRDDPIVEETRAARRELDAEFGGDMEALLKCLKEIEAVASDRLGGYPERQTRAR